MLNFDGHCDGEGDGTYKQTFSKTLTHWRALWTDLIPSFGTANYEHNFRSRCVGSQITTRQEPPSLYWTGRSLNSQTPTAGKSGSSVSCITTLRRLWETLRSTSSAQQKGSKWADAGHAKFKHQLAPLMFTHTHCIYFRVNLWLIICRSIYFDIS